MIWLLKLLLVLETIQVRLKKIKRRTRNNPCFLSKDEIKEAEEAKERTQRLLSDALKKKESLLVEDPKVFGDLNLKKLCPFLTTDLVEELIRELEKVTFAKNKDPKQDIGTVAYVYRGSEDRTIYLCELFWKMDPKFKSHQDTIIHEVCHILGYDHTVQENSDGVQKSPQSMLCPQTTFSVASALTSSMDHPGTFTDGSYSCCGETSRDTVCEKSWICNHIRLVKLIDKVERLWKQILLVPRCPAGDETDTTSDDTDAPVEELESDTCSVKTEFSFEDPDISDDEIDESEEQTDIVMQMIKRWTTLVKTLSGLLKTQTNLLEKQKYLMKQINLLKMDRNLLKTQRNLLKTKRNLLKKQRNLLKTKRNLLRQRNLLSQRNLLRQRNLLSQRNLLKTQRNLLMAQDNVLKEEDNMEKTLDDKDDEWEILFDMFKTSDNVKKTKADVVNTLSDLLKTLADVLETQYMQKR
ncbi:unnamed protein product [Ranitomeya imitator]|uniref:Lysine-specific metallo-endopeptidase domain-containing protein n=1 Tax=Ranitomeya imitator TaxID=111125 RepID=A0ABN9L7B2_9NEOB|nr:unnamed protein product [Ranitomeya imitator]